MAIIIAALIAIAIPVFTSQLEKSRDSVSVANMRSAYSEAATAMLTSEGKAVGKTGNVTVAAIANDKQVVTVENVEFQGTVTGFSGLDTELPFTATSGILGESASTGGVAQKYTLTFTFDMKNNTCELTNIA